MAELTDSSVLDSERYLANKQQMDSVKKDEDSLQDIADFVMVSSDGIMNPNLAVMLKDLANQIVLNKAELAKTPGNEEQSVQPTPEELVAMQNAQMPMEQGIPPGMGGFQGGMPPM